MAKEEKRATTEELTDVKTSSGPAEASAPVRPIGKVQQGSGEAATSEVPTADMDTEGKKEVIVNPALRGDASVPYVDEEGNLKTEVFVAGKTHYVDSETAELKFGAVDMFITPPENNE